MGNHKHHAATHRQGAGRCGEPFRIVSNYVKNPDKTDEGRLVTSYQCNGEIADAEFLLAKRQYIAATGRVRGKDDIIAYHLRQSLCRVRSRRKKPTAWGIELARRFTKGNHAFIVCTPH